MKFQLLKQAVNGPAVPQAVFDNLYDAKENDLKVILYVLSKGDISLADITAHLHITARAAQSSLLFWSDKGLILYEETLFDRPKKKKTLSRRQILQIAGRQPEINVLVAEIQKIYGHPLNERGTGVYISLYLDENIPIEVILLLAAHLVPGTDKTPAYTARIIRDLYSKKGVTSRDKAEEYISLCNSRGERYRRVCRIFGLDRDKLTQREKTMIDSWGEKLSMSYDMIDAARLAAGANDSLQYVNGILKSWSQKGFCRPEDITEFSRTGEKAEIDEEEDIMLQGADFVPVFEGA